MPPRHDKAETLRRPTSRPGFPAGRTVNPLLSVNYPTGVLVYSKTVNVDRHPGSPRPALYCVLKETALSCSVHATPRPQVLSDWEKAHLFFNNTPDLG